MVAGRRRRLEVAASIVRCRHACRWLGIVLAAVYATTPLAGPVGASRYQTSTAR